MSSGAEPEPTSRSCAVLARAKINVSLRVLAREHTGYHQIETTFCLLELADELELTLGGRDVALDVQAPPEELAPPPDLGPVHRNLAYRAAVAFRDRTGIADGVHVRLVKRVPPGSGLGGGSSDAAAVLTALNALHGAPLSDRDLIELSGSLGSDVPFFVARATLAFAWGRGGRIAPLAPLAVKPVLLALSEHHIATADAYAALAALRGDRYEAPAALLRLTPLTWRDLATTAVNDFEDVVFPQLPELAAVRAALQRHGALCARLTGSGSAVFGIFDDRSTLDAALAALAAQFTTTRFVATETATLPAA